jgi:hypothetical protein
VIRAPWFLVTVLVAALLAVGFIFGQVRVISSQKPSRPRLEYVGVVKGPGYMPADAISDCGILVYLHGPDRLAAVYLPCEVLK